MEASTPSSGFFHCVVSPSSSGPEPELVGQAIPSWPSDPSLPLVLLLCASETQCCKIYHLGARAQWPLPVGGMGKNSEDRSGESREFPPHPLLWGGHHWQDGLSSHWAALAPGFTDSIPSLCLTNWGMVMVFSCSSLGFLTIPFSVFSTPL